MARVYIAGPMTGRPNLNADAFIRAKGMLHLLGHEPVSPLDLNLASGLISMAHDGTVSEAVGYSRSAALSGDVRALVQCDAIALLSGWQESKEASLEERIARALGLRRLHVDFAVGRVRPALLVGLSGYARSGKDTACAGLVEHAGFVRLAFADAVRTALAAIDPLVPYGDELVRTSTLVATCGWDIAKAGDEVRSLLQRVGAEGGRQVHGEDAWVDVAMRAADHRTVFSDVRFPNEADAIRSLGGIVVRINRPGVGPANGHTSETALDNYEFDFVVTNAGTVGQLQAAVVLLVNSWIERNADSLAA